MHVRFETEGNFKKILDILRNFQNRDARAALSSIGNEGVRRLERTTPKDSGETAASWDYTVQNTRKGPVLGIYNHGHPELPVNIAVLKDVGHGTGTGGYVPPANYITPTMDKTFSRAGDIIAKELIDP